MNSGLRADTNPVLVRSGEPYGRFWADLHGQSEETIGTPIQTGRKLLPRLLRSRLPWRVKLEALVHLTNNVSYLLMVLLSLLVYPAMAVRSDAALHTALLVDLPLFMAATVSVLGFYVASQVAAGRPWRREVLYLPAMMGLGIGLSLNNARAVLSGLVQQGGVFHRTPKYRIEHKGEGWGDKRYRVSADPVVALEAAFALYLAAGLLLAWQARLWVSLPFLYLFFHGYSYMLLLHVASWRQRGLSGWRARPADG